MTPSSSPHFKPAPSQNLPSAEAADGKRPLDSSPFAGRFYPHKERNVCDLLPERDRDQVFARIQAAWALTDADLAQQRLELLGSELGRTWPDAAASLREGMPDTPLMRLGIDGQLAKTLFSTNPCESMIEIGRYTRAT